MLGELGMSARVDRWTPAQKEIARQSIADYKRIRPLIASGDIYHLTPPPHVGESPSGWMAIQYVSTDAAHSAMLAFRLTQSAPQQTLNLRGLNDTARYRIHGDGVQEGIFTGAQLKSSGVVVNRPEQWQSSLVELDQIH
jgi:alpha-galactosidase